jgi:hypothetical protein
MRLDDAAAIRPVEDVLFRDVDGEAVILNLDTEIYFGLNDSGTSMWLALTESGSVGEAIQRLLREFEVDEADLRADVAELVAKLQAKGLVEVRNGV